MKSLFDNPQANSIKALATRCFATRKTASFGIAPRLSQEKITSYQIDLFCLETPPTTYFDDRHRDQRDSVAAFYAERISWITINTELLAASFSSNPETFGKAALWSGQSAYQENLAFGQEAANALQDEAVAFRSITKNLTISMQKLMSFEKHDEIYKFVMKRGSGIQPK